MQNKKKDYYGCFDLSFDSTDKPNISFDASFDCGKEPKEVDIFEKIKQVFAE